MRKTDLVEIKKGSVGRGLLIENDGYISMDEGNNKRLVEDFNRAEEWYCPYPFIVSAVFQKYGIQNANGRIYPEEVLRKQVELYQQKIKEKRALGECYTPDVLVLTEKGWKTLADIKEGENILTLNTETQEVEIKPVLRKIEKDFDGEMIQIKGRNIDDLVTPQHKFPLFSSRDNKYVGSYTAEDMMEGRVHDLGHKYIKRDGINNEYFSLKSKTKGIHLDERFIHFSKVPYKGQVMCLEVENHTFFVMSNGKSHWTNNCNHPAESTIDLGRVSHNIIELHWEGRTLVGKMELNLSQGFVKQGICSTLGDTVANLLLNGYKIGVSSRGVGSVEQRLGKMIVEEFELICWDCVSEPSTPSAWIGQSEEELLPYLENKKVEGSVISEKINKIKELL